METLTRRMIETPLEVRNLESRTIGGLAIPFNRIVTIIPGLQEEFLPGSVSIHTRGCFLFWFHQPDQVLASVETGRLRLETRDDGVYYEAELPDTTLGNDLLKLIQLREVRGVSPGFAVDDQRWTYGDRINTRHIVKCRVGELSLTHLPAYPTSSIELRNQGGDGEKELKQIADRVAYMSRLRSQTMNRILSRFKGN